MSNEHRYRLQRYKGKSTRHQCPQCGDKFSFTLYIDTETGEPIDETCGRCNHENTCAYNYTPREFFRDHHIEHFGVGDVNVTNNPITPAPVSKEPTFIPVEIVKRSQIKAIDNPLALFLFDKGIPADDLIRVWLDYRTGKTTDGSVVYWQVDEQRRVRAGKIIKYETDGHRDKSTFPPVGWIHSFAAFKKRYPNYTLSQCLFGAHRLSQYPSSIVGLVEAEKTCLVCSCLMPNFVWVATGGKQQNLNADSLKVLTGRTVVVFPDLDAYDLWTEKLMPMLSRICKSVTMSDYIRKVANPEDSTTDLADILLNEFQRNVTSRTPGELMANQYPELQSLIYELDLQERV